MSNFFDRVNEIFKAGWWTGASWLLTLCAIQVLLGTFYVIIHHVKPGYEYVQLETEQVKTLNDLLAVYPDTQLPTSILEESLYKGKDTAYKERICDSITNLRERRTIMIGQFLRTAYKEDSKTGSGNEIDNALAEMDPMLRELNTRDVATYITAKRFKLSSYFWLAGTRMYWEAVLWSMLGVITSLIYYVSLANQLALKKRADDDIGPFDTSEISAQVAKMFYAPAITLVLVLGYSYISGTNKNAVDISVNHGLILFSFIAGFYSGRVMKLLDSIKNLILPVSSDGNPNQPVTPPASATGDITVSLKLADSMANNPDTPGIIEAGFNAAVVELVPAEKPGESIPLDKPSEDQASAFTKSKIPFGKYTIKVKYAFDNKKTVVNLSASQDIEFNAGSLAFTVALALDNSQG